MTTKTERAKTSWTGKEILEVEETPVNWLIEEILPQGFGFIAGRKKIGKSFLVLQACLSVVVPKMDFLGYKTKTGRVLYLSLEGSYRQIKRRMSKMISSLGIEDYSHLNNFEVEERWPKINGIGYDLLLKTIKKKKYTWIVIDTWQKAFSIRNNNDASEVAKFVDPLYELTRAGELSITFVDHFHKPSQYSGDVIDDISGSGVKGGVSDTVWGLTRQRGKQDARLDIVSRDTEIDGLDIFFDRDKGLWLARSENDIKPGSNQEKILEAMSTSQEELWTREIARTLDMDVSLVSREMNELSKKGLIEKIPEKSNGKVPYRVKSKRIN